MQIQGAQRGSGSTKAASAAASEQTDSTIAERRKPKAGTSNNVNATKMKNIGDELILEICASLSPHYNEIFVGTMTIPEALQNIEVICGVGPEARPPGKTKEKLIENLTGEAGRRVNDGDIPRRNLSLLIFSRGEEGSQSLLKPRRDCLWCSRR